MKLVFALLIAFGSSAVFAEGAEDLFENLQDHEIFAVKTLADLRVGPDTRRHSIRIRNCASDISHIMLRIEDAPLYVSGAGATFSDGSNKQYSFSYTFAAGYDSPWMGVDNFREPGKCVTKIFLNARSNDPGVRSRVKVLGNTGG